MVPKSYSPWAAHSFQRSFVSTLLATRSKKIADFTNYG